MQELQSLIELDMVSYDMFNLLPLSEYEVYVKKFGSDDARQVAIQTGEDNMEADTQTDTVPSSSVWVQWPPEDLRGYGREEEGGGGGGDGDGESEGGVAGGVAAAGQGAVKLVSFLKRAGQVSELHCVRVYASLFLRPSVIGVLGSVRRELGVEGEGPFPFCSIPVPVLHQPSWHRQYPIHPLW